MDLELSGRVMLITGGSDGLGAAAARELVREGARVAICARNQDRLDTYARSLNEDGGDVLAVAADVTRPEDLERFVSAAHQRWGRVDGLLNNAGTATSGPLNSMTDQQWTDDLQLKLFGAIRMCRLVYPAMKAGGGGSIVNVLNVAAKAPPAMSMPTSVSRAAGMAFTKALSKEWAQDAIRVNAVNIGLIASGQWVRRAQAQSIPVGELYQRLARERAIPLGRVGRSEEFADLIAFLMSARSSYITGASINIDGGNSPVV